MNHGVFVISVVVIKALLCLVDIPTLGKRTIGWK